MFNEKHVYREEAGDESDSGSSSLLDGASGGDAGGDSGDWLYADNVKGEGDKPDWFNGDKYKSIADQAAAYPELAKKMGAHTGAPEEYDIALPEGSNELFTLDAESETVQEFLTAAKESGVNQEFMSQAMAFHVGAMEAALGDLVPNKEAELSALGKDALSRINNVADWGQANLSEEEFDQLKSVTSTADGIALVERLIDMSRGQKVPDSNTTSQPDGMTPEKLREMRYEKDENGNLKSQLDPAHKKKVDEAYKALYGAGPRSETVTM